MDLINWFWKEFLFFLKRLLTRQVGLAFQHLHFSDETNEILIWGMQQLQLKIEKTLFDFYFKMKYLINKRNIHGYQYDNNQKIFFIQSF